MNWHTRYSQQANWTRDLRTYILENIKARAVHRILEVGCGTGAILSELPAQPERHGLDINFDALRESRAHVPYAALVQGDAAELPYFNRSFDIVYCHFLLLWVSNPLRALQEMKRVAKPGGYVIAFAEPDYPGRIDQPKELTVLGEWQTEALRRQGANPALGGRLAELFFEAGIQIVETGTIRSQEREPFRQEWELEWQVIESDLQDAVPSTDIQHMKRLDREAREQGKRVLHVPTHFAWGRT